MEHGADVNSDAFIMAYRLKHENILNYLVKNSAYIQYILDTSPQRRNKSTINFIFNYFLN